MLEIPERTKLDVAFSTDDLSWLPMEKIPEEFKSSFNKWARIASRWFFNGLPGGTEFVPKDGVDVHKAMMAIRCALSSFEPKHQHKEAAVAYMLSEWFSDIKVPEAQSR